MLVCTTQRHVTWPTSVCRRRLWTVVASLALQSPGPSWCPGLGRLLASYCLLLRTAPGPGTDFQRPSDHQNLLELASFKRQLKTHSSVPAPDSAGCSCGCRVPSSHRRCCDYTASSAPTTNVQTRLNSTRDHRRIGMRSELNLSIAATGPIRRRRWSRNV